MIDPTASLSIDRTSLSLAALVFSGVDDDSAYELLDMNEPARIARLSYAATSPHIHGDLPTAAVWEQTTLAATVRLTGSTQAELNTRKDELLAALGQFSYTVTQTVNGQASTWSCAWGSLAPASDVLQYEELRRLRQTYRITIPTQPLDA